MPTDTSCGSFTEPSGVLRLASQSNAITLPAKGLRVHSSGSELLRALHSMDAKDYCTCLAGLTLVTSVTLHSGEFAQQPKFD